jgi:hypothetical protein
MKTYSMTIQEALKDQPKLLEKVESTIKKEADAWTQKCREKIQQRVFDKRRRNRDEKATILQSEVRGTEKHQ